MSSPILEFHYDISCPFAYIASTRVQALAERTNATLIHRPVLLGAIYRATAAPQGAGGSASDVYNPAKKAVGKQSIVRTFKRYKIRDNPPPQHPRKTVNALRLLYCVPDGVERRILTARLYSAYWVEGRDVSDNNVLLQIVKESGIASGEKLGEWCFSDAHAKSELQQATADAIERGAFGVPGFWIPDALWSDVGGDSKKGRFFWGQDRMHFVEATLISLSNGKNEWGNVSGLRSLMPRCVPTNTPKGKTKVQFWFDFSSPWAFLGYTQLARLQRTFPSLEIELKPFLLGILFKEIGAPNMPMLAISKAKALWSRQDHADWTAYWNAVNTQEGGKDAKIDFCWASQFPIRTPTVLRVSIVEPKTIPLLFSACWEQDANVSDEAVLAAVLNKGGFNGAELITRANAPAAKTRLRELTAEAKELGLCGVPTYRVLRDGELVGGVVWGQDEIAVVEDLIAGWDISSDALAEAGKVNYGKEKAGSKL
ncbi:thioredoxin-like protein [Dothidotthia symphoricarpi CBS 119687]|uniref:Thioredoxin-like protein n=1 Tax=Dothidotthia symphoricarpi CBS 119687 TaxID=1392245 RepID=A0A6A5ZY05_9PLEO|nr:thioredoxin-like protein [Dothidotthia symphoricarpi CBS 119687]KAF2124166.1 thioredoxin-like protein [Dothidotthia symphoricarpi CBS 119687]